MADDETDHTPNPHDFTDPSPNPAQDADLVVLGDVLREHGIRRVAVRYEGCGDSGSVEEVTYEPEGVALPAGVDDRLRDVAEGYCPDGYENDAGGYGTLTVYPVHGLATLEHSNCYEDALEMDAGVASLPEDLRRRLARSGVTGLTAHFDGYGDSGQIDDLAVEPDGVALDDALREELEGFLLDQLPGGWEINEGSYGDFTVDVPAGRVEVTACWRTEEASDAQVTRWQWRP